MCKTNYKSLSQYTHELQRDVMGISFSYDRYPDHDVENFAERQALIAWLNKKGIGYELCLPFAGLLAWELYHGDLYIDIVVEEEGDIVKQIEEQWCDEVEVTIYPYHSHVDITSSDEDYGKQKSSNLPLERFALTRAFMIEAAVRIKGENSSFWEEALKDYRIHSRCGCGECLSFYLTPSPGEGVFERGYVLEDFNDTTVIFRVNEQGQLTDFELPFITDVPFLREYKEYDNPDFISSTTPEQAALRVHTWFEKNLESKMLTLVIE